MSGIMSRLARTFGRPVDVHFEEAPHAPLRGSLAGLDWSPMSDGKLSSHELTIVTSQIEDIQSKADKLREMVDHGPGRHDRQLNFLSELLLDDLKQLKDRIARMYGQVPDHGRPLDNVDEREIEQRR